jgi:phenylacetic acid degradation operon negative regulatory protein
VAISDNTRLGQLILTIFALYGRAEGNWLSVAALVALVADLGADGQAARSSVSRLKRRGVLTSERRDGSAGYSLTAPTLEMLPPGWNRVSAGELFGALNTALGSPARDHALEVIRAKGA